MAERLGRVLYWFGCLAAFLLAAGGIWVLTSTNDYRPGFIAFVMAPAVLAWLLGRACRYVLADD